MIRSPINSLSARTCNIIGSQIDTLVISIKARTSHTHCVCVFVSVRVYRRDHFKEVSLDLENETPQATVSAAVVILGVHNLQHPPKVVSTIMV